MMMYCYLYACCTKCSDEVLQDDCELQALLTALRSNVAPHGISVMSYKVKLYKDEVVVCCWWTMPSM